MATEVLERLGDAQNAHDLAAFVVCFDPAYRSEQPVHPHRAFTGREQVRENWAEVVAGDDVLVGVAEHLCRQVRQEDLIGRLGGDEFILGAGAIGRTGAEQPAERIRTAIGSSRIDARSHRAS